MQYGHATKIEESLIGSMEDLRRRYESRFGRDKCVSIFLDIAIQGKMPWDDQVGQYHRCVYGRQGNGGYAKDNICHMRIVSRHAMRRAKSDKARAFFQAKYDLLTEIKTWADAYYG